MDNELSTRLTGLGLTKYEAAAWLALLGRSGTSSAELGGRAGIPRQRIYDVLVSLEGKGLARSTDTNPRSWYAVEPSEALEGLAARQAEELERRRQALASESRALAAELAPLYRGGLGRNDPLFYVDMLGSASRIAQKALEFARTARRRVNGCIKRPFILDEEHNRRVIREPLERGVSFRAVYEASALEDPELRGMMAAFAGWGQEIRLVADLPLKMHCFDDEAVLVSMQDPVGGPPRFTALAIRHKGMVEMMNLAFESLWREGEPWRP